jgi:hypothetical protein
MNIDGKPKESEPKGGMDLDESLSETASELRHLKETAKSRANRDRVKAD